MPASVELVSVIVGFGLITLAGVRLGAGSHLSFTGLFASQSGSDWPRGVQEGDVPRFAVEHAESLRHPPAIEPYEELAGDEAEAQPPALVELHVRRVGPRR
jgi:hypothetical protein